MSVIESDEYRKARKALSEDPILIAMAEEIRSVDRNEIMWEDGTPRNHFMMGALREYESRGGKLPTYGMGDVARAVVMVLDAA